MTAVIPAQALATYQRVDSPGASTSAAESGAGTGFGDVLSRALGGAVQAGEEADALSAQALSGQADITHVVTAVSRAELALQSTVAIRDRVLQAYQDIIKMPI